MARHQLLDYLQSTHFWLADATPQFGLSALPFWALNPVLGFATVSGPEWQAETKPVKSGTSLFTRTTVKGHTVQPIVMTRGALWYDSDLSRWMTRAQHGRGVPRRNLILIQFMRKGFRLEQISDVALGLGASLGVGAVGVAAGLGGGFLSTALGLMASQGMDAALGGTGLMRFPARMWELGECIPTRLKIGDFDAKSADVLVDELEVQPSYVNQISLLD